MSTEETPTTNSLDRPMQQPDRHFWRLAKARFEIEEMAGRYPSKNEAYQVLADAVHGLDKAARHFGLPPLWFKGTSAHGGGRLTHKGCVPPLDED